MSYNLTTPVKNQLRGILLELHEIYQPLRTLCSVKTISCIPIGKYIQTSLLWLLTKNAGFIIHVESEK